MNYPKWANYSMFLGGGFFLLAIVFSLINLGAIFWYPGAILWSVGFIRYGYWFLFQRLSFQVIGYGPVNVAGTGFIFQPPTGWTVESVTGFPLPSCFGSPISNFRPNIAFEIDNFSGSIEESLAHANALSSSSSNWAIISSGYISTNQGHKGLRSIAQYNGPTGQMRVITYVFNRNKDIKVHIHCTSPASQGGLLDTVFDQSVANIRIE